MPKVQTNNRIDERIRDAGYAVLKEIGMSPAELFEGCLEYVIKHHKPPFKREIVSEEDAELLMMVKAALADDDEIIDVPRDKLREVLRL